MRGLIVRWSFLLCLAGCNCLLAQPFFLRKDMPAGEHPLFVVAGDFNGDRRPDLAVYDWSTWELSGVNEGLYVLLNAGGGNFGRPIRAGVDVNGLEVADVNGDGKDDLVTNDGVYLSRGDGTFQPAQPINNGQRYVVVRTAGDFNRDGRSDVLITDQIAGTRVLLSNGDGTFRSGPTLTALPITFALVADFNRDGRSDILCTVLGLNDYRDVIFLGNGDGTFGAEIQVAVHRGEREPFAADFNGDGLPDLATRAGILLGRGDGSFSSPVPYPWLEKSNPGLFLYSAADLTGDGKADLVIGVGTIDNLTTNSISIYPGKGDGTFSAPLEQTVGWGDYSDHRVVAVDVDGDGRLDLVTANRESNTLSVVMAKAQGGPAFRRAVSAASDTAIVAPQSLATLFAPTPATASASATPPWPTRLGGISLEVRDSAGTTRLAPLLFASPTQINFQVPAGTALGEAALAVVGDRGTTEAGSMQVEAVAPGLFMASHNPLIPAVTGILVEPGGTQVPVLVFSCSGTSCQFDTIPLSTAGDHPIYLSFYGTGFRGANPDNVIVRDLITGVRLPVLYAGPQGTPGLDQINVRLLPAVLNQHELFIDVSIRIEGVAANRAVLVIRGLD